MTAGPAMRPYIRYPALIGLPPLGVPGIGSTIRFEIPSKYARNDNTALWYNSPNVL